MPLKDYLDYIPKLCIHSMKKIQFACVMFIVYMYSDFYNFCGLIAYNIYYAQTVDACGQFMDCTAQSSDTIQHFLECCQCLYWKKRMNYLQK